MVNTEYLCIFFVFWIGASVGSFINVAAMRTVAEKKWWGAERSACDKCGRVLSFVDLIPVISYLALGGKCRTCDAHIDRRHFLAEIATGLIAAVLVWRLGPSYLLFFSLAMLPFFLFNTLTDLESGYIYDSWCIATVVVALILRLAGGIPAIIDGTLGMALGFGVILMIITVSRGGMGFGDAMLMLGIGAFFGWKMTILVLYLGFLSGGAVVIPLLLMKKVSRKDAVPMGPFLVMGALLTIFFGAACLSYFGYALPWPWNLMR